MKRAGPIAMDNISFEIEKFWRNRFADEIESCYMGLEDDEITKWFNEGLRYASNIVRYSRDDNS
jgi:hypothetical protein